jgi:hypothetical protein
MLRSPIESAERSADSMMVKISVDQIVWLGYDPPKVTAKNVMPILSVDQIR